MIGDTARLIAILNLDRSLVDISKYCIYISIVNLLFY